MEITLLGPLRVTVDGGIVGIPGVRLGRLLTRLAAEVPGTVSVAALGDAVWDADTPADPANALQSLVSRLRRVLGGPDAVVQTVAGYRLSAPRSAVDLLRFDDEIRDASRVLPRDPQRAWDLCTTALSRWGDEPDHPEAIPGLARRQALRDDARLTRAAAGLVLGRGADVVDELAETVAADPDREDAVRLLMRAYATAGRGAEGLALFDQLRRRLATHLGIDPAPETQAVHLELLRAGRGPAAEPPPPSNLPAPLSSFVGRDDELRRLGVLLQRSRLVTVLGPGGVGKTRLALRAAADSRSRHPDGVWLVDLASVTEASGIGPAVVTGIGAREARIIGRPVAETVAADPLQRLVSQLEHVVCLLVLDNCEHLIEPVAVLVAELLARCPQVSVLTTSREPLAITGEALMVVPPLGLPDPVRAEVGRARGPSDADPGDGVWSAPSMQLFVDRAQAAHPGFRAGPDTRDDVVEIVRRLDGLPLAIELAAARLRVVPLVEVRRRLDDRFRMLTGGSRTSLPRHRTLRAVVEWSWDLLGDDERRLVDRLSVFPAGATVPAAAAVFGGDAADVAVLLDALVDRSLIVVSDPAPLRYRMLETLREFGLERLAAAGALDDARTAHARYMTDLVLTSSPVLRTAAQIPALRTLEAEHENIVAALRFLVTGPTPARAVDAAHALMWFWVVSGRHTEAIPVLSVVLASTRGSTDPHRVYLEASLTMNEVADEMSRAHRSWDELRATMREMADRLDAAAPWDDPTALVLRAAVRLFAGPDGPGAPAVSEALASPDPWVRGTVRSIRVNFLENDGLIDTIRDDADLAYADFLEVGDRWGLSVVLSTRGLLRTLDGDLDGALADYRRAWDCATEFGTSDDDLLVLLRMADVHLRRGEIAQARAAVTRVSDAGSVRTTDGARLLFSRATLLMATWSGEGPEVAYRDVAAVRDELAGHASGSALHGHVQAVTRAAMAFVCIRAGHVDEGLAELTLAYPLAVGTHDQPIIAIVGVSVAAAVSASGHPDIAAEMLGAGCRLRGSDDPTDLIVRVITAEATARLGDAFASAHDRGRRMDPAAAILRLSPVAWVAQSGQARRR